MSKEIDLKLLNECMIYNSITGDLIWKVRPLEHFVNKRVWKTWNVKYSGKVVGYIHMAKNKLKYKSRVTTLNNKQYKCHRLAWVLYYQEQPPEQIDHEDHDATNNAINNLKSASYETNRKNVTRQSNNTSGVTGVCFRSDTGKWLALGWIKHKKTIIGNYTIKEEAIAARNEWTIKNNFHINHGKINSYE